MGELRVARWKKYGKDRLYVSESDGRSIGWVDLLSGAESLDEPDLVAEFRAGVQSYCAAHGLLAHHPGAPSATMPVSTGSSEPRPADLAVDPTGLAASPEPEWTDLAAHVPGQLARAQAEAELAAARERSRLRTILSRAVDAKTDERAWRVGAAGEETVGGRLERLRKHGFFILHSVPIGSRGSDVDHVVIGPGGVWTVNTKNHPGKPVWVGRHQVRVGGHPTHYLRNSRFEAERASRLLTEACGFPVFVRPVLVFLTGTLIPDVTIKQPPDDVVVLDRMDVPRAFRRAPRRLTEDQIQLVHGHARRSTTWTD